jgi:hypothetical protein
MSFVAGDRITYPGNSGTIYGEIIGVRQMPNVNQTQVYRIQWFTDHNFTVRKGVSSSYNMRMIDTKGKLYDPNGALQPPPQVGATASPPFKIGDFILKRNAMVPTRHVVLDLLMSPAPNSQHAGYRIKNVKSKVESDISLSAASMWKKSANQSPGPMAFTAPTVGNVKVTGSIMTSKSSFGGGFKEQAELEWQVKWLAVPTISLCDCGGHKCGYRDDELHGHATWCKLNDKITILIPHGERQ